MSTINVNVNGTRHDLTPEQVDDIISQAYNVIQEVRAVRFRFTRVEQAVAELDEAAVAAGIVPIPE